jgi:hypothetical protein
VDGQELEQQLRNRLEVLESQDSAAHLAGDLAVRDIVLTVIGLALAIVAMVWWAY